MFATTLLRQTLQRSRANSPLIVSAFPTSLFHATATASTQLNNLSTPSHDDIVRVLSERTMIRGLEGPVERLMERVQTRVRKQPGLISFQALVDGDDPNKFLVLTRWASQQHLDNWLEEDDYKTAVQTMDEYTEGPIDYRVMKSPKDDLFLL